MHVHFVVHEAFEAPGAYENWARDRGHEASHSRVHQHEPGAMGVCADEKKPRHADGA